MATIRDATTLSHEVRRGEVFGAVKLYNLDDPTKPEGSARRILGMTCPTPGVQARACPVTR